MIKRILIEHDDGRIEELFPQGTRPAPRPGESTRCPHCQFGRIGSGYCPVCDLGRDLRRIETAMPNPVGGMDS